MKHGEKAAMLEVKQVPHVRVRATGGSGGRGRYTSNVGRSGW